MLADEEDDRASLAPFGVRRSVASPVAAPEGEPASERVSLSPGAGTLLGNRYRLASRLGEGGMGTVWQAHDDVLDIDVAVKVMRPGQAGGESGERMVREARSTARLVHPSVVRIFDLGRTDDDEPYIVMELLRGELLGALMDRRARMSATESIALLLPIASALRLAHHQGIVHRDLKPENILLSELELGKVVPKVLDFGIAKLRHLGLTRLTQTNAVMGTPDYMSPEQARGRGDVDERTDIWAFTVMLYECMCLRRPFQELNYNAQMRAILDDEPLPIMAYGAGDEALWAVVARGLTKHPKDRWQSIHALGEALAQWAHARGLEHDVAGGSLVAHWLPEGVAACIVAESVPVPACPAAPEAPTLAALVSTAEPGEPSPSAAVERPPLWRRRGVAATLTVALTVLVAGASLWRAMPPDPVVAEASTAVSPLEQPVPAPPQTPAAASEDPSEDTSRPAASTGGTARAAPASAGSPPRQRAAPVKAPRPKAPVREPPERLDLPPATPNF